MSTIQVEAQLSSEQLLKAVQQLSEQELEQLFDKIVELRSPQLAPRLPLAESELIAKINQPMPLDRRQRYHKLIAKRRAGSLTDSEYEELLQLTDEAENADAERMRCLVELARIREITLDELMIQMGIQPPSYE
jgi:hypothetical protein